jgi:uncharacterized membrane protein
VAESTSSGSRDFLRALQVPGLPRWAVPASLALAVVGLGLSVYLTVEHFTSPGTLACPANGAVDCAQVTTSPQSTLVGIPVALLGLVFFAAALALCLPVVWRRPDPRLWRLRVGVAALGLAFVLYLIFAELFLIEALCVWCTGVHLVAFGFFAVVVRATAMADPSPFDQR